MNDQTGPISQQSTGLTMPAEWNRHRATWVAWPHNQDTWPDNLQKAQQEFVALVRMIACDEIVFVVAAGDALASAQQHLSEIQNVEFVEFPTNDAWIRDYGPTFLLNRQTGRTEIAGWRYNGWGEKYPPLDDDIAIAEKIGKYLNMSCHGADLVIEGGSIEVNDAGLLLTTESCLLHGNRNGRVKQPEIESYFETYLGKRTIWIPDLEIDGDDTDGHIDQQARFINDQTVLLVRSDHQQALFEQSRQILTDVGLEVIPFQMPAPTTAYGNILPASYLNFYFCNRGLIVPQFGDRTSDETAVAQLKELVVDRDVVGLPSIELACGLGSFHCLTQQQPEVN